MNCCIRVDGESVVDLSTLLRHVAPSAPEIPYELALDFLRQAYTEFARRSNLLVAHKDVYTQRDVLNYSLVAPVGYEVFALSDAANTAYGYTLFPNANHWYYAWGDRFRMVGNAEVVFERAPSRDNVAYSFGLHVLPNDCVTTMPTEIATPYGKGIAMGALADILDMPGKSWSSPRMADKKRMEFARTCLSARNLHLTNRGATTPMMRPVRVL